MAKNKSNFNIQEPVYAIGDIHGCLTVLLRLEDSIKAHMRANGLTRAKVIYLGDYIDRGPNSAGVIRHLFEQTAPEFERIFLRGNHESEMLRFIENPSEDYNWITRNVGGVSTLKSFKIDFHDIIQNNHSWPEIETRDQLVTALGESTLAKLKNLPYSLKIDDYLFVHAGINPYRSLDKQDEMDLIWIRDVFLSCNHSYGFMVIHGHTPTSSEGFKPHVRTNRINIDTGAFAGGSLTAIYLNKDNYEFISIPNNLLG